MSILNIAQNISIDNSTYSFKKIGVDKGLLQSFILLIIQDGRGYLWFGSATGLNRYDGYEFLVYRNIVTHHFVSYSKVSFKFQYPKIK